MTEQVPVAVAVLAGRVVDDVTKAELFAASRGMVPDEISLWRVVEDPNCPEDVVEHDVDAEVTAELDMFGKEAVLPCELCILVDTVILAVVKHVTESSIAEPEGWPGAAWLAVTIAKVPMAVNRARAFIMNDVYGFECAME